LTGKEGDRVGFQFLAVMGGEGLNQTSDSRELISWNGVGDNEDSPMRPPVIKKLNRKPDEIVSIPGYQTPPALDGKIQLLQVRCFTHSSLVSTHSVDAIFSENGSNLGTEVLIQIEFHVEDLMKG
jgi:hypothetical protein